MNDNQATVDSFFGFSRLTELGSEDYEKILEEMPIDRIKEAIEDSNPSLAKFITAEALIRSLASLLDIPLWDVIDKVWTEGKLFDKYCDPENYDRNELITIGLKDHEISSEHKPSIEVLLNGKKIGSIEFQLDVTLTLTGAVLHVRGGDIEELQAGQIQGSATLAYEEVELLIRKTEKMDLPGKIKFSKPAKSREGT
jgi:hypothetical protein